MSDGSFISHAQNSEDVVLWRALQFVANGHYVEVGANHPRVDSVTLAFYDRGWSGITIEPLEEFGALHRAQRPRDIQVLAAVTQGDQDSITLHSVSGSGLSSTVDAIGESHRLTGRDVEDIVVPAKSLDQILADAGWGNKPIHFMVIDVEGAEDVALRGLDLHVHRPWILVIEATEPNSTAPTHSLWEPTLLAAGYTFCLFDGLSRFYVADEHRELLGPRLSYPACVFDDFTSAQSNELQQTVEQLGSTVSEVERQLISWRHKALVEWAEIAATAVRESEADRLSRELEALQNSVSWRVTEPIRGARRAIGRLR